MRLFILPLLLLLLHQKQQQSFLHYAFSIRFYYTFTCHVFFLMSLDLCALSHAHNVQTNVQIKAHKNHWTNESICIIR